MTSDHNREGPAWRRKKPAIRVRHKIVPWFANRCICLHPLAVSARSPGVVERLDFL